jgi:predicted ester cyclase
MPDPIEGVRMNRFSRVLGLALAFVILSLLTATGLPIRAQDATPAADCPTASPAEIETLLNRYWSDVWTAGGDAASAGVLVPDEIHHWGIGGDTTGVDAFNERLRLFLTAFPDIRFTVDLTAVEGDLGATLWTATGTHRGEWQGIAPTDREVTWRGINIFRIACGLIAESWGEADHIGLRQQLGAADVPAPAATPAEDADAVEPAAGATPCPDDSPEANVAVARRWTEEVWTKQDLAVLDEIFDPNGVHHGAAFSTVRGPEAVKAAIQRQLQTFPDMALTVDMTIADGDLVVVRWSGTATHAGPFLGIEPTDKKVDLTGINVYRLSCGRIVESWSEINALDLLRQLRETE